MPGTPFSTFAPKLFAIEELTFAANKGFYFTDANTPATYDLTAFGRSVGGLADAAAGRTLFGLGSLATLSSVNGGNWSGTDLAVGDGGTGASTAAGARANLGVVIGTDVQAYNGNLAALAGQTLAADKLIYSTGPGALAQADFTPGAWVSWVPTVTATTPAGSGAVYTVASAKYAKVGRIVVVTLQLTVTNLGTGPSASGNITVTLPFTAAASASGYGTENAVTGNMIQGNVSQGSNILTLKTYNGGASAVLNYQLRVSMTFESTT